MTAQEKILASDEAWNTRELGEDFAHAEVLKDDIKESQIDDALELQAISIRLQKSLIDDFKAIAALRGVSYQPLMRQVLTRFADCEKKQILRDRVMEMRATKKASQAQPESPPKQKKAA